MIYNSPVATTSTLSFNVIPNALGFTTAMTLKLINDATNKEIGNTLTVATYDTNGILTVSTTIDDTGIIEGNFYTIELYNGSTIYWKGILFCSSQAKTSYSINNGDFTEETSNNEYIILD